VAATGEVTRIVGKRGRSGDHHMAAIGLCDT
jgi:hypothetical protein